MTVGLLLGGGIGAGGLCAAPDVRPPLALQEVNPDLLSAGVFAALDGQGAFGVPPAPARARATYPDVSKGRRTAVLDARVGTNIRLGDDPDSLPAVQRGQAEPHLARSAAHPALLLATYQEGRYADGGAVGNGYSVSRDGGLTWSRGLSPALTSAKGGPYVRATDPVAAIGPDGSLYLNALVSLDATFGRSAVVLQRSDDSGDTWSAPIVIFQPPNAQVFADKNWLAVNDYPGAPNPGRLVATWTNFTSNAAGASTGNHLVAASSDDRGATWTAPVNITPPGSSNQGTQPLFLPDGSLGVVYVTFVNPNDTRQFSLNYRHSADGGRTFPATATTIVGLVSGWDDPELRDGIFLPSATVARESGDIFVTYTAVTAGTPRVMVTRSGNRGATWTTPVVVSDQPPGRSVCNPAVAASADGRTVSIVFIDKRHAPDGVGQVDLSAAFSFDGGATWQPNIRLTEMSSELRFGPPTSRGVMLGDYLGVVPALGPDAAGVAIWCDTRTGDSDPFTVRFTPMPEPNYGTWSVAHQLRDTHLADEDDDGMINYLEYLHGTDPRRPESGENLVVRPVSPASVEIAWTERATVARLPISDGISIARMVTFTAGGFSMSATLAGTPTSGAILPSREGLAWRGVRIEVQPGEAYAIAPSVHFSAGLPVQAARRVTTFATNARLINLSARAWSGPGAQQLIAGFAVEGRKSVLIRAAGPALAALGVVDALRDPRLTIVSEPGSAAGANDQWQQGAITAALFARLGAFPFAAGSSDAAILIDAANRGYTAVVSGIDDTAGVALVEAYDADPVPGAAGSSRLINLATRAFAGTGGETLVSGLVIAGTQPRRVLLRAVGPGLGAFGVDGALADPVLTLFRGSTALEANDDWERSRSSAAIAATAVRIGAFPLASDSRDAALLVTLAPGNYTVTVTGADGGTGIALVEVYDAD